MACTLLCNSDFELPVVSSGAGHFIPKCQVPCWDTTNTESNSDPACPVGVIEFWRGPIGPGPHSGQQFIELNASQIAKLFQTFTAVPGSTVSISFWHAGRVGYPNHMQASIIDGAGVGGTVLFTTGSISGVVNVWTQHTFTYTFPSVGTTYTVVFETLDPGAGGNFLDDIEVNLVPPTVTAGSNSPVNIGGTILLTASSPSTIVSYAWTGPNGFTSSLQNPMITPANPLMAGTYTVTAVDGYGCQAIATTNVIIIEAPCYLVTDCTGVQPPFITSTNLDAYVGQTVQTCINTLPPTLSKPKSAAAVINCYILTNCCNPNHQIVVNAPNNVPNYSGLVITFSVLYPGICWSIQLSTCSDPYPSNYVPIVWNSTAFQLHDSCAICTTAIGFPCNIPIAFFKLTNCCDPSQVLVLGSTSTFPYQDMVVQIPSLPEFGQDCWFVEKGQSSVGAVVFNPFTNPVLSYVDCAASPCACVENWPDGCYCVTIEEALTCEGNAPWPGIITAVFPDCDTCTKECYLLTDCAGVLPDLLVSNDFAEFVGMIVQLHNCGSTCWLVELADDCDDSVCVPPVSIAFATCEDCLPPPPEPEPLVLHPRRVKPGYYTPGCDPAYTEKVNCSYSDAIYNEMIQVRFGVTMCCEEDNMKWDIKKQLLDLRAIYDPSLCKSIYQICEAPCGVMATLNIFTPMTCPAPATVFASLEID